MPTVRYLKLKVELSTYVVGDDGAHLEDRHTYEKTFTDGSGSGQVEAVWQDRSRNLNATSEDLDLAGGLTDFQGAAITYTGIRLLYFENLDEDTGDSFVLGGASSNAWTGFFNDATDKGTVPPGGLVLVVAPVDSMGVVAGTGDQFKIEATDNSDYKLVIGGTTS